MYTRLQPVPNRSFLLFGPRSTGKTTWLRSVLPDQSRAGCGGQLAYWRTPSGSEVDLVWTRGAKAVGIEVKATRRWRREDGAALAGLVADRHVKRAYGVYLGAERLQQGPLRVLPLTYFLSALRDGDVIG